MLDASFFDAHQELWTSWRHDLHKNPELAFQEHRTSEFVAERLSSFGIEVHRGYAGTGIVGVLKTALSKSLQTIHLGFVLSPRPNKQIG